MRVMLKIFEDKKSGLGNYFFFALLPMKIAYGRLESKVVLLSYDMFCFFC